MNGITNENIKIFSYLKDIEVDMGLVNKIYSQMIVDKDLIANEKRFPHIFNEINNQSKQDILELDDKEIEVVNAIITEIMFVVAFVADLKVASKVDFNGLMPLCEDNGSLFFEIKLYLVSEFSEVPLDIIASDDFKKKDYDMPDNYPYIFVSYIKEYLQI